MAPIGIEVRRRPRRTSPFYPEVPSCQVPNLSFLYSHFLGERSNGIFVEVGAYDGFTYSNTWGLAERGWSGLLVEPVPDLAERCRRAHRSHTAVRVVETAAGSADDEQLELYVGEHLSTADRRQLEEYARVSWARGYFPSQSVSVPSSTLDTILERHGVKPALDVLVVDVEGFEAEVFAGFTVSRWKPLMMIVELSDVHPELTVSRLSHFQLGQRLLEEGYRIVYKDSINTILVRKDLADARYGADTGPSIVETKPKMGL